MSSALESEGPDASSVIAGVPADVARALRSDLVTARIAPGEAVTEASVAARFGVARATARLAIDQLVGAGLLRREPNRGARVPVLTRADIIDLYDNRALVEGAALAALAETGCVPAEAVRRNRSLEAAPDDAAFAADDIAFHRALVAAQPSPRLTRIHESLMGEIELCIGQVQAHALLRPADIAVQHAEMLAALLVGDANRAARVARDHIRLSRDRLVDHVDRAAASPETSEPNKES